MTSNCDKCRGTGWIVVDRDGKEYAVRCDCAAAELLTLKADTAGIPPRFADSRFSNIEVLNEHIGTALSKSRAFSGDFPGTDRGLFFIGRPGVGKTKIMCAIANEIIEKLPKATVIYVDWNDLVRDLGSGESFESRDFSLIRKLTDGIKAADLVLFDELGATKVSEYVHSKVYDIINTRYNRMRPTCFATNFIVERLKERIGERLTSRIGEMTDTITVIGKDYRVR